MATSEQSGKTGGDSGQLIRQLAHQSFDDHGRQVVKEAIRNFISSGSLITFIYALSSVCFEDEHFNFLHQIQAHLPKQLQEDYNALCGMMVEGFSNYLKHNTLATEKITPVSMSNNKEQPRRITDKNGFTKHSSLPASKKGAASRATPKYRTITDVIQFKNSHGMIITYIYIYFIPSLNSGSNLESLNYTCMYYLRLMHFYNVGLFSRKSPSRASHSKGKRPLKKKFQTVLLFRNNDESLGMNIKGGKEFGCGVYISKVEPDSQAERQVNIAVVSSLLDDLALNQKL